MVKKCIFAKQLHHRSLAGSTPLKVLMFQELEPSQKTFAYSKSATETLKKGVKNVQS